LISYFVLNVIIYNHIMVKQPVSTKACVSTINLRLKHFRSSTIRYVLKVTGYASLTEYEDLCYSSDNFPHTFTLNSGNILCDYTNVDYTTYRIFNLSIHNLNDDVRKYVLSKLIGMDQVDYELFNHEKNRLIVWIPYKTEESKLKGSVFVDLGLAPGVDYEDKVDKVEQYEDLSEIHVPFEPKDLQGWVFKMNESTKNSYVLTPPKKILFVKEGKVNWGELKSGKDGWFSTPTTWHLPLEFLQRPIYYNNNVGGWIVSLRYKTQLLDMGAKEKK